MKNPDARDMLIGALWLIACDQNIYTHDQMIEVAVEGLSKYLELEQVDALPETFTKQAKQIRLTVLEESYDHRAEN